MTTTIPGAVTPVTNENGAEILVVDPAHLGEFLAEVAEARRDAAITPRDPEVVEPKRPRPLATIAAEIRADWAKPYFGAVPYIEAMGRLDKITDPYGADDAETIVRYFLVNARTWRGETARRVKAELKAVLP